MADEKEASNGEGGKTAKAKRDAEVVTMDDGSSVEFVGKRKVLKKGIIGEDGTLQIRMDFRNGNTRTYELNPDLIPQFAVHGALQKYGDELAGEEGDLEDWVKTTDALHERLGKGEWREERGESMAGITVLVRALVEFSGSTTEVVQEKLKGKSKRERDAMAATAQLKPIIDRLNAERLSKGAKVDTDALLAGFKEAA